MLLFSPPALRATPLVNAGGKAPFALLVGAGQCPAHNPMEFPDCLRQCDFAPKIAGRGIAPPLQSFCKICEFPCHCEERSDVAISCYQPPKCSAETDNAPGETPKIAYAGRKSSKFLEKYVENVK